MEKIIVMEQSELRKLIDEALDQYKENQSGKINKRWLNTVEAMERLGIKSKTTLNKLRNIGAIKYSQPVKKIILYDNESLDEYLERNAKERF